MLFGWWQVETFDPFPFPAGDLPVNDLDYFDSLIKPLVDLEEWESDSESPA